MDSMMVTKGKNIFFILSFLLFLVSGCMDTGKKLQIRKGSRIVLIGNNLCSRMMNFGHFETELHVRYPDSTLYVRNMCDGGDTPGFRPHSGRNDPWPFEEAVNFQNELAQISKSEGHLEYPDEWMTRHKADIVVAFFGYNESFEGKEGVENFKNELKAFIQHTQSQTYNGKSTPQLAIVSPIAFEDLSRIMDLPDGVKENENLLLYSKAMEQVCTESDVLFINAFDPSKEWYKAGIQTTDGHQLHDGGYKKLAILLADQLFGRSKNAVSTHQNIINAAVLEKNWFWHNDYKMPNGVHAFGRRYDPFGPDNYPAEYKKLREMTSIRDTAIWKAAHGEKFDLEEADSKTSTIPPVESNYKPGDYGRGTDEYLYGQDALDKIFVAPGYKIELFASEVEFPDLANPVQLSFDDKGRLWVAVMPTYPHWKPGDPKPNDKLIILEDTNGDNKADKQTTFVDGLHIPVGFELAPEGVYVSQGTNLKLFTDTNGDDKADREEIILSGFDDHDTHHVISAFSADPSGALYMAEGVFLHTNVETSYGPVRATNGGFYRYNPHRRHLERTAQLSIPNPWGIAFDEYGQNFFLETSGPAMRWMMPGTIKPRYGIFTHKSKDLIKEEFKVRPTSGLEFVSSRHFPDEHQGDFLLNNSIGFLGMKQHQLKESGTGYETDFRQDLVWSDDPNFRPVDMEFAPDGSLYLVDWHNVLIGHMQHNARDPYRDHVHGRIYRITYPSRPLVPPVKIEGASVEVLLANLKLPEYRARYRTRRALRAKDRYEVIAKVPTWIMKLDRDDPNFERWQLEALWVTWGVNLTDKILLNACLKAEDHRVRAAAVRVLRYTGHQIPDQHERLMQAAADPHGRVRLEAIVAASWLDKDKGLEILEQAGRLPMDDWMIHAYRTAENHLNDQNLMVEKKKNLNETNLKGNDLAAFNTGKEIYARDGYCVTCHQEDGKGLSATGYPTLRGTDWVLGSEDRLIKLTLKGLHGPLRIGGREYEGLVPMTPYEGLLDDEEIAAVLTYVRNTFGNSASVITSETVKRVREEVKDKKGFYSPDELLAAHPIN